jgi:integrase/recombinase XerD
MGRLAMNQVPQLNKVNATLLESYEIDCQLRALSQGTIRSNRSNIRTVGKHLESLNLNYVDIDNEALKQILDYLINTRKVRYKTLDGYFTALSSFYEFLQFEKHVPGNPILAFRKRYLKRYKKTQNQSTRKLITVDEMSMLINGTLEIRDRAIMTVFAKTGVRRGELITMDLEDIDWGNERIKLKPKNKRSNLYVYFDNETAIILKKWMRTRDLYNGTTPALFIGEQGNRIGRNVLYNLVTKHAQRMGLHNLDSPRLEDHFSPHCFRHWFTTHLRRNGMNREFIKELRGDSRGEAIDIYDHIDHQELRKAYLAAIPRLGLF